MVSEKVKDLLLLASAWQKSMHLEAREESTVAIFLRYLNQENYGAGQRYMLPDTTITMNFSRKATRGADRMEIQKYHQPTNGQTEMGRC